MGRLRGGCRAGSGQGTAEFAMVSLMLLLLFLGVLDLGRGVLQRQDLANAAREGARFAVISEASRAKSAQAFAADVAAAAAQRAPTLSLSAANFGASAGSITCDTWASSAAPGPRGARLVAPLGGGIVALGGLIVAKKPPSGGGGGGGWATIACSAAQPGDRITVCAGYTFRPAYQRVLGVGAIAMSDCAAVTVQ